MEHQVGKRHRVACRRVDSVERGQTGRSMIDVLDEAVVEWMTTVGSIATTASGLNSRMTRTSSSRSARSFSSAPSGRCRNDDLVVAHDSGRGPLFLLAQPGQLERIGGRVVGTGVTRLCSRRVARRCPRAPRRQSCRRSRSRRHRGGRRSPKRVPDAPNERPEKRLVIVISLPANLACRWRCSCAYCALRHRSSPPTGDVSFVFAARRQEARAARSSSSASSTSAAWPSGLTFGQTRAIEPVGVDQESRCAGRPCSSSRNCVFSTHVPYISAT